MKRTLSIVLSLFMIIIFISAFVGCGADIKAENEKLKAENTNLKSDNDKLRIEVQNLKEENQKAAAEKDAKINTLTADNETLKKQVADLQAKTAKKKKK